MVVRSSELSKWFQISKPLASVKDYYGNTDVKGPASTGTSGHPEFLKSVVGA